MVLLREIDCSCSLGVGVEADVLDLHVAGDVLEHPPALVRVLPLSLSFLLVFVGGDPVGAGGVVPVLVGFLVAPHLLVVDVPGDSWGSLPPEVVESTVVVGCQGPVFHLLRAFQVEALLSRLVSPAGIHHSWDGPAEETAEPVDAETHWF